jgi:hypothetical protein
MFWENILSTKPTKYINFEICYNMSKMDGSIDNVVIVRLALCLLMY